ncbi:MAG: hypothetical protein ACR2JV_05590, partial [Gaiellales bacterium]
PRCYVAVVSAVPEYALLSLRRLGLLALGGVILGAIAISPPVADAAERWGLIHYTQHALIFTAGVALGFAIRDFLRARPMSARSAVLLGAVALILDLASLLPPFDEAIDTNAALHIAQHGLVVLAGIVVGIAIRDVLALTHRIRATAGSRESAA